MQCETCVFWKRKNDISEAGRCRRYAPKPINWFVPDSGEEDDAEPTPEAVWPVTWNDDWCGEWQSMFGGKKWGE